MGEPPPLDLTHVLVRLHWWLQVLWVKGPRLGAGLAKGPGLGPGSARGQGLGPGLFLDLPGRTVSTRSQFPL